ncbi:hypothetical protein TcWFU_007198 [Taenia crassiceps]|uniref:Uncharacterized protein n=1 Tax=Taenia crassiceps TaxID=6207 RepID=A0ABR4QB64_9CEST
MFTTTSNSTSIQPSIYHCTHSPTYTPPTMPLLFHSRQPASFQRHSHSHTPPNHQLHQLFLFFPLFFRFILFLFCFFSSSTHHILLLQLLLLLLLLLLHRLRRLCRLRCLSHSCLLQPLILIFLHPLLHFFFYYCFTSNSAYASINVAHCQLTRKHYLLRLSPFRLTPIPCC